MHIEPIVTVDAPSIRSPDVVAPRDAGPNLGVVRPTAVRRTRPRTTGAGEAAAMHASSYTALVRRINTEGLLDRRHGWYLIRGLVLIGLTSRNITGGWLVERFKGGLNFQIEHHLFPNTPRANLNCARLIVRAYCADLGVDDEERTFFGAWGTVLRYLHRVGVRHADPIDCSAALVFRTA